MCRHYVVYIFKRTYYGASVLVSAGPGWFTRCTRLVSWDVVYFPGTGVGGNRFNWRDYGKCKWTWGCIASSSEIVDWCVGQDITDQRGCPNQSGWQFADEGLVSSHFDCLPDGSEESSLHSSWNKRSRSLIRDWLETYSVWISRSISFHDCRLLRLVWVLRILRSSFLCASDSVVHFWEPSLAWLILVVTVCKSQVVESRNYRLYPRARRLLLAQEWAAEF